jgi:hypothetical protein
MKSYDENRSVIVDRKFDIRTKPVSDATLWFEKTGYEPVKLFASNGYTTSATTKNVDGTYTIIMQPTATPATTQAK